ncbi:MAG: hypothetical protein WB565_10265 [Acidimicrobiales bacterium]
MNAEPSSSATPSIDAWIADEGEEAVISAVQEAQREIAEGRAFELGKEGDLEEFMRRRRPRSA